MESSTSVFGNSDESQDGRQCRLYPLVLPLEYRTYRVAVGGKSEVCQTGSGRTLHLSSHRMVLESDHELCIGQIVDLSIAWPVSLNKLAALTLRVRGHIVHTEQNITEVVVKQYKFHTRLA